MLVGISESSDIWSPKQLIFRPRWLKDIAEVSQVAAQRAISLATFGKCQGCKKENNLLFHGENYRHSKHFEQCQLIGLDVDEGMSLSSAVDILESTGLQYAVLTTKSHQQWKNKGKANESPPQDRFRIFIPCAEPTKNPKTVTHNLRLFAERIRIDRNCVDPARFFKPSPGIVRIKQNGSLYRWREPNEEALKRREQQHIAALRSYGKSGIVPLFVKKLLNDGAPEGGRNSACYSIGKSLGTAGFPLHRIMDMVLSSPLASLGRSEIETAVKNGFNNKA